MIKRCFGTGSPLYEKYHDDEWGVPSHNDQHLYEMLILEGAQAGLSWETVLKKRENYRRLFHQFDPLKVAQMTDADLEEILLNSGIIRNRLKVNSARRNAQVFLEIQKEFGSFDRYIWNFVGKKPLINHWQSLSQVPAKTPLSDTISIDLKKRGMNFVGSTIIYAFLQAVGVVDDHYLKCHKRKG